MSLGFRHNRLFSLSVLLALLGCCAAQVNYFPNKCAAVCRSQHQFINTIPPTPIPTDRIVKQWSHVALNQIAANLGQTSPPAVGRALGVFSTCLYDAISLFDSSLTPVAATRVPKQKFSSSPKEVFDAIDGAAYTALKHIFRAFPSVARVEHFFTQRQQAFDPSTINGFLGGLSPFTSQPFQDILSRVPSFTTTSTALELGKQACNAVIAAYTADGYDGIGRPLPGKPRPIYTPVNLPQRLSGITNCPAEIRNLNRWQPVCVPRQASTQVNTGHTNCQVQSFIDPSAGTKTTFALPSGTVNEGAKLIQAVKRVDRTVQGGPPLHGHPEYENQLLELIAASGKLDDPQKLVAEFWADGPDFTAPAGHLFTIALDAAVERGLSDFDMIKLLMLIGNAENDAGVAAWRTKVTYDYIRPLAMIQCSKTGQSNGDILAWRGPYLGVGPMKASAWQPYQKDTFKTPGFAAYVSGHSTFSFAASEILKLYFGSDQYVGPNCKFFNEGEALFESRVGPGQAGYIPGVTDVPNQGPGTIGYSPRSPVVLCWQTFTEAADQASESRQYGGIHIRADLTDGNALGREIGKAVFVKGMKLFGKATNVRSIF